jgi:tRNA 2-thiouridine synthesizing protein E
MNPEGGIKNIVEYRLVMRMFLNHFWHASCSAMNWGIPNGLRRRSTRAAFSTARHSTRKDAPMDTFIYQSKKYPVDEHGFLIDRDDWDEEFAKGKAEESGILDGLTDEHWKIIGFIRESFKKGGECPTVHQTCKANRLFIRDLKRLFPAGYLRGACKLSGITCNDRVVNYYGEEQDLREEAIPRATKTAKIYRVDAHGFLIEPSEWDREFAANLARALKVPGGLTKEHWKVIHFLRETFAETGEIPAVYDTCERNQLEVEDLGRLFPDGYHRGAVKLAGLRYR